MKTVTQYKEDIKALMKKANDIEAKCTLENRDPSAAELNLQNEILDTVKEYKHIVDTMARRDRITEDLSGPSVGPQTLQNTQSTRVQSEKDKFPTMGGFLNAVMRASIPGGTTDPRLNITNAATGMGETIPSDGGFLVQSDHQTQLLEDVFKTALLAGKPRRIPISGNSNGTTINGFDETSRVNGSRHGGVVVYWIDEAGTITPSKPKFRQIDLKLKKVAGLVYMTSEMMDDSGVIESVTRSAFVSELGYALDDVLINGTGAGQPLGILNAGCLVSVAKETGQDKETVVFENITKMRSRLFASSRANSVWLINQNIEPQLHSMSIGVGTGGAPVYMPAGGLSGLPYDTLYGRPVLPIEQCKTVGTVGDIILADFEDGYILADKGGIRSDMSIHVQFLTDQAAFRFILRVDGQPVRASALTPANGGATSTQSHFVALAERA